MLIFYSLGKAFEVDAEPSTRVEEVMQALHRLASVSPGDQILLFRGQGLDQRKTLQDYGLPGPQGPAAPETDALFLFNRQHLLPNAPPPSAHELVPLDPAFRLPPFQPPAHSIDHSVNPTLRALAELYRRAWADHHRASALDRWAAASLEGCEAALSECHVMGLSVEAALTNVDALFRAVDRQVQAVLARHGSIRQWTEEALRRLEHDLDTLAAVPLHPRLRAAAMPPTSSPPSTSTSGRAAASSLLDLVPQGPARVRDWGQHCGRLARAVEGKVGRFDEAYKALGSEVEALLLRTPQSDLAALQGHVDAVRAYVRVEARPILDALGEDFGQVERLLQMVAESEGLAHLPPPQAPSPSSASAHQNVLGQLSSSVLRGAGRGLHFLESALGGGGRGPLQSSSPSPSPSALGSSPRVSGGFGVAAEALRALERMLERHAAVCGPVLTELERRLVDLLQAVSRGRDTMLRDSHAHVAALSALQTGVRGLQAKAKGLDGILAQWEEDAAQLGVMRRVPQAYRLALREALRQREFDQLFRLEAQRKAEGLARARESEKARRRQVVEQTGPLLSTSVLAALGLLREPALCEISVTGGGGLSGGASALGSVLLDPGLPEVTQADFEHVDRILAQRGTLLGDIPRAGSSGPASPGPSTPLGGPGRLSMEGHEGVGSGRETAEAQDPLEVARLRAELADFRVRETLRELAGTSLDSNPPGTSTPTRTGTQPALNPGTPRTTSGLPMSASGSPRGPKTLDTQGPPLSQSQTQAAVDALRQGLRAKEALLAAVYGTVGELKGTIQRQEDRILELEALLERAHRERGLAVSVATNTPPSSAAPAPLPFPSPFATVPPTHPGPSPSSNVIGGLQRAFKAISQSPPPRRGPGSVSSDLTPEDSPKDQLDITAAAAAHPPLPTTTVSPRVEIRLEVTGTAGVRLLVTEGDRELYGGTGGPPPLSPQLDLNLSLSTDTFLPSTVLMDLLEHKSATASPSGSTSEVTSASRVITAPPPLAATGAGEHVQGAIISAGWGAEGPSNAGVSPFLAASGILAAAAAPEPEPRSSETDEEDIPEI